MAARSEPGPERGVPHVPRSPSGRIPQWAIDEALGVAPTNDVPWRTDLIPPAQRPPGPAHRRRSRRRRWVRVMSVLLFTGLIGGMTAWTMSSPDGDTAPPLADHIGVWTTYRNGPTPGVGSNPEPIGTPPPLEVASDAFRFHTDDSGAQDSSSPMAAYDPCRPIHYVVNDDDAPPGTDGLIAGAIDRISAATGLEFVDDGTTDEVPDLLRRAFQPDRYGDRWAPVLIAWTTPALIPGLAGDVVGLGGSAAVSMRGHSPVYVTGQIDLDAPQLAQVMRRSDGAEDVRSVIMHELGHVVGLDHVNDPTQIMYPQGMPGITEFAVGDLTGLNALGRGRCAPEL